MLVNIALLRCILYNCKTYNCDQIHRGERYTNENEFVRVLNLYGCCMLVLDHDSHEDIQCQQIL